MLKLRFTSAPGQEGARVGTAVLAPHTVVMVRVVDAVGICGADEKDIQAVDDLVDRDDLRIGGAGRVFVEKLRCELYGSEWRSPFARMQAGDDKQRRLGEDGRILGDAKQLDRRRAGEPRVRSVIAVRELGEIGQLGERRKRRVQRSRKPRRCQVHRDIREAGGRARRGIVERAELRMSTATPASLSNAISASDRTVTILSLRRSA